MKRLTLLLLLLLPLIARAQSQPWVSVNTPANGATVGQNFTLTGTASPSLIVQVSGDLRASVYADRSGNWSIPLSAAGMGEDQVVDLQVTCRDSSGNVSRPVSLSYAINGSGNAGPNDAPLQLSVNLPANGATIPGTLVLSGTATPGLQVRVSGTLQGRTYADANGNWNLGLSTDGLAQGTIISLNVTGQDQRGNQSRTVSLRYAKG